MRLRTASTQQQQKKTSICVTTARASSTTPTPISSSRAPSREFSRESSSRPDDTSLSFSQQDPMFTSSTVCYCNGIRHLGNLEVHCALCKRWFHQNCFQDLKDFGGLPFMVSYVFHCRNCSSDGHEKWTIKSATFSHMCVMALANLTLEYRLKMAADDGVEVKSTADEEDIPKYFSLEDEIIPYMEKHWEYLSTTARRQKKTWHQTIAKTLQKDIELFVPDPSNTATTSSANTNQQQQTTIGGSGGSETGGETPTTQQQQQHQRCAFSLRERDLFRIGPMHEAIVQLSKRHSSSSSAGGTPTAVEKELLGLGALEADVQQSVLSDLTGGPKTRGASKRKAAAALAVSCSPSSSTSAAGATANGGGSDSKLLSLMVSVGGLSAPKKAKLASSNEFSSMQLLGASAGVFVDVPYNREGYRYYLVEKDPNILNRDQFNTEELNNNTRAVQIPSHIYRLTIPTSVTLSPNDRANQLIVELDNLMVTGNEGHSVVRATHSVCHGSWFYEMDFLAQPDESHVRVGWAQANAILLASLGYGKFGYSWRSKHGTAFHDAYGKHFHKRGFRQGDVVEITAQGFAPSDVLPASRKDCDLIKFKQIYFFEEKDEPQHALQQLKPLRGSKIEFFLNGQSAGVAYEDIFFGHYFPAVSLFQSARVRFNFGPKFRYAPQAVRDGTAWPLSARPEQQQTEQTLADAVFMTVNAEELERRNADYFAALAAKDSQQQQQQPTTK
uniref:B30.2/SPRY domain-containing protein n=1 Tax=Globodera rostochiensis TaxID=31243 RepID=A0A914I702_GLORO